MLTNGETSNYEIIRFAQKLGIPLKSVCFNHQFAQLKPEPGFYVINLGNQRIGGTHWTGALLTSENLYYFDSAGTPPPPSVEIFAKAAKVHDIVYSQTQIQSINENYCGQFVLMWMYDMMTSKLPKIEDRYQQFLNKFHKLRHIT